MSENTNTTPAQEEKTFTQEQLNNIVSERLTKERSKNDSALAQKEQEFLQRELRLSAKELLSEKGLPVQLLDALNCTSAESLQKSISIIEESFKTKQTGATKVKLRGVVPGESDSDPRDKSDHSIREAMGL